MKWWWIGDGGYGTDRDENAVSWKTHIFPEPLKDKILKSLKERGMTIPKKDHVLALKTTDDFALDGGGPCSADEPFRDYQLDGLKFSMPVTQIEFFFYNLRDDLKPRDDIGATYYKTCGAWHCICLRPEDREMLLEQIEKDLPEVRALVEIENQRWNEFVEGAKKDGVPLRMSKRPVGDIGEA